MTLPLRQCAASLVFNAHGEVLLVQQNYGAHLWGAPGGIVEVGETPMQAAIREAFEETGLEINIEKVIGIYLLQGGGWPDILAHVFQATIVSGTPHIVNADEIAAFTWCSVAEPPDEIVHDIEAALEDSRAQRCGVVRAVQRKRVMTPFTLM